MWEEEWRPVQVHSDGPVWDSKHANSSYGKRSVCAPLSERPFTQQRRFASAIQLNYGKRCAREGLAGAESDGISL